MIKPDAGKIMPGFRRIITSSRISRSPFLKDLILRIPEIDPARDLGKEFPGVKGFSARALWEMRRFYAAYHGDTNLQQLVAEIPWGHNLVPLTSVKDLTEREWYIRETIRNA